jgi:hypothetical protein
MRFASCQRGVVVRNRNNSGEGKLNGLRKVNKRKLLLGGDGRHPLDGFRETDIMADRVFRTPISCLVLGDDDNYIGGLNHALLIDSKALEFFLLSLPL